MRSVSYHSPFEKIVRRTFVILTKMGYTITAINEAKEIIKAKKQRHWYCPKVSLDININKIDEHTVSISVTAEETKHYFFTQVKGTDKLEEEFITMLISYM